MIQSFRSKETEQLFKGQRVRGFGPDLIKQARDKCDLLDNTRELNDLVIPPGNKREALRGDRAGQYSIRVNEQYRICFRWENGSAANVELVDYH
jgi:proteic killer suppression protein